MNRPEGTSADDDPSRDYATIAIVGLGLIGGSLALAWRRAGYRGRIVGVSRPRSLDEARTLAAGCADNEPGGSCPISDPDCLSTSCATTDCASCLGGAGPKDGSYCKVDVSFCTHFHTSSVCTDCSPTADFIYVTANGYFSTLDVTSLVTTVCVHAAVPNGLP